MKLGIITFHRGLNFGGLLQAHCLQQKLSCMGYDSTIVDFDIHEQHRQERRLLRRRLLRFRREDWEALYHRFSRIIVFDSEYKKIAKSRRVKERDLQKHVAQYDVLVFGSDEIWNVTNVAFPENLVFFGKDLPACRKIAYAPSCGSASYKDLSSNQAILESLRSFDSVSARDTETQKIITRLIGRNVPVVIDPTLFFNSDFFPSNGKRVRANDYALVYMNGLDIHCIDYLKGQETNGLDIVALFYKKTQLGINKINVSLACWLDHFRSARFVVTNTFHGLIFSLIFERPFILDSTHAKRQKVQNLLSEFTDENDLHSLLDDNADINQRLDLSRKVIEKYGRDIDGLRSRSEEYLKKALMSHAPDPEAN